MDLQSDTYHSFLQGDKKSFQLLVKAHFQRTYNCIFTYTKDKEDSKTILKEVFKKIWSDRDNLDPYSSFENCLELVVQEFVLNHLHEVADSAGLTKKMRKNILSLRGQQAEYTLQKTQVFAAETIQNRALQLKLLPKLSTTEG